MDTQHIIDSMHIHVFEFMYTYTRHVCITGVYMIL